MSFKHDSYMGDGRECDPDLMTDDYMCKCGFRLQSLEHMPDCKPEAVRYCIDCGEMEPIDS